MTIWHVLVYAGLGLVGGYIAAHKGYRPIWGILGGIFFGPLALIVAACLPRTQAGREQAALQAQTAQELAYSKQTQPCPRCGRENSVVARVCPKCEFRFEKVMMAD